MSKGRRGGWRASIEDRLNGIWYGGRRPGGLLRLLAWIHARRLARQARPSRNRAGEGLPTPVIVIGNLTAGGSGKSPLVAWVAERARSLGLKPGIISRGYGGVGTAHPVRVLADSDPAQVGDEPVMLAHQTGVPVVVCTQRRLAALALGTEVDVVIADDGLQHRGLPRDFEVVVVDARRGFGNGRLLPAGPLREPETRLDSVDLVVASGSPEGMELVPAGFVRLSDGKRCALEHFAAEKAVHAVAGVGHPDRFFETLEQVLGRETQRRPYPDHWVFHAREMGALATACVVMTAKDAVKCRPFAGEDWWYLDVEARLGAAPAAALTAWLTACKDGLNTP